jgi:hypothetical protein
VASDECEVLLLLPELLVCAIWFEEPKSVTEDEPNELKLEEPPDVTEKAYDVECVGWHDVVGTLSISVKWVKT